MKRKIISCLIALIGVVLALYPWISNWVSQNTADKKVTVYQNTVKNATAEQQDGMILQAKKYNENLSQNQVTLTDPFLEEEICAKENLKYDTTLNVDGNGMMAFLEIPCINVNLPIFHGTDTNTLESSVGHLEGSSLPVGGRDSHSVLTGHTGLNKAKLFTDLTEMKKEDLFFIHVAGKTLAYQVFEISIVKPEETDRLMIRKGEDIVTLVTCTPYGVNTHRLFVTGKRIKYTPMIHKKAEKKNPDSMWMRTYRHALLLGFLISFALIALLQFLRNIRRKRIKIRKP